MRPLGGFIYKRARTLEEAWSTALRHPEGYRYLAGGTDLLVQLKTGKIRTPLLISLNGVHSLKGLTDYGEWIKIGPLTPVGDVARSQLLKEMIPLLPMAAVQLGSPQVRNLATIGGNLCNASPAGDLSTALLCLNAEVRIEGPQGARSDKLEDFFKGPGSTSLKSSEVMTGILVSGMKKTWHWDYQKLGSRRAMEIGIVNVAIGLNLEEGICKEGRIALGAVAPLPIRAQKAEGLMVGEKFSRELVDEVGRAAAQVASPIDDLRASGAYRKEMVQNLVRRGLTVLWGSRTSEG